MVLFHPTLGRLKDFAGQALEASKRSRVAGHLAACPKCRGRVGSLAALSNELRSLPVPAPPGGLRLRIANSLHTGTRVASLTTDEPRTRRRVSHLAVAAALIAAIALGARLLEREPHPTGPPHDADWMHTDPLAGLPLWPRVGAAQEANARVVPPKYAVITDLDAGNVIPGSWTYRQQTITDDILTQVSGALRLRIEGGTHLGARVWVVTWGPASDTSWVDSTSLGHADLRLIHHVRRGGRGRLTLVQEFSADSVFEALELTGPRTRSFRGGAALPAPVHVVAYWNALDLGLLAQALPLTPSWRGSTYLVQWVSMDSISPTFLPLDLRVTGSEWVDVPAGRFDCWRLDVQTGGDPLPLRVWISKHRRWLVRTEVRGPDYRVETLLVSGPLGD